MEFYLGKRRQQGFNAIPLTAWNDFGPITRPNADGSNDWVLVVDDAAKGYPAPGIIER